MSTHLKCVCVGDAAVGKTSMLMSHFTRNFPVDYIPGLFDNFETSLMAEHQNIALNVWDTEGRDGFERVRPLSYAQTDVFIVCYAVDSPTSLEHVTSTWLPEIRHHCPNVPFVLVGTKSDLRRNARDHERLRGEKRTFVDPELAKEVGKTLGASAVLECSAKKCSAKTQLSIEDVLIGASKVALACRNKYKKKKKKKTKCTLL